MFKNKEGKVRSGWIIIGTYILFFLLLTLISMVSLIAFKYFITTTKGTDISTYIITKEGMQLQKYINVVLTLIQEALLILTPIIIWRYVMKRPLSNMGLRSIRSHKKELIAGLIFGAVSMSVVFCIIILTGNAKVVSWKPQFSIDILLYLLVFIMVGFAEEIFGRGFIMATLRRTKNIPVVVIVSSIIFALLHSGNSGIDIIPYMNITLVGLLLAYIYLRSGNIWMAIGYHITWNYLQGNIFGFPVSGTHSKGLFTVIYEENNIINGSIFGPEGGIVVTAVVLLGFLFVKKYYKNKEYDFLAEEPASLEFEVEEVVAEQTKD